VRRFIRENEATGPYVDSDKQGDNFHTLPFSLELKKFFTFRPAQPIILCEPFISSKARW